MKSKEFIQKYKDKNRLHFLKSEFPLAVFDTENGLNNYQGPSL